MRKYMLLIVSIVIVILSFLNSWYSDQLFDLLFIFALIPSVFLIIGWIVCLILSIKKIRKDDKVIGIIILTMLLITLFLVLFFPFRKVKTILELKVYEENRWKIVNMIRNNELEVNDLGIVSLPTKYKELSYSGEVVVYQNNEDGQVVAFWIFRGMLSGSVQLIYSSDGEELIRTNGSSHPIVNIDKLKDNWYYVVTDY